MSKVQSSVQRSFEFDVATLKALFRDAKRKSREEADSLTFCLLRAREAC